jgi:superfamily II DNA or RNA helicase
MADVIINKLNEVFLQLEVSNDIAMEIHSAFSVMVPGFRFMPLYKAHLWSGSTSFFEFNSFKIGIGFLPKLLQFCQSFNYTYELKFDESSLKNKITDEEITEFLKTILPPESKYKLRDYQEKALREMLKSKKCLVEMPTGSGKSLLIYCIVKYLQMIGFKEKFVIITSSIGLILQLRQDFIDYGFLDFDDYFGTIYFDSTNKDFSKQFLISTWQTLHKMPQNYLSLFGAFLIDEVHESTFKSKVLVDVLAKLNRASWRIGTTGTLPRSVQINMMSLIGYIGRIVSTVTSSELIKKGVLAKVQVVNVILKYPESLIEKSGIYNDEVEKIIHYPDRNKIFKYIVDRVGEKKNILILVQRIEHLRNIREYLQREFSTKNIYEIYNKIEGDERERIRKIVNVNQGSIIVATFKTCSVGINIPNLSVVIFGSSYKSSQVVIQAIGRGIRKTEIKNNMTLFDIVDSLCWEKRGGAIGTNYLYDHFLERLKIYRTQGFPYKNIQLNISDL